MIYIIDTREQKPFRLNPSKRKKLEVGDYTTIKLENKFHVERKSLQDLYGTLTANNNRFKYELFRAAYFKIKIVVVVEGTFDAFINKRFPKGNERKFSKEGLVKMIATFERKYFLEFHWFETRLHANEATRKLLGAVE